MEVITRVIMVGAVIIAVAVGDHELTRSHFIPRNEHPHAFIHSCCSNVYVKILNEYTTSKQKMIQLATYIAIISHIKLLSLLAIASRASSYIK